MDTQFIPKLVHVKQYSWQEDFDNRPGFSFVVDALPQGADWNADKKDAAWFYERRGKIFRAVNGPLMRYLSSDGKPTHGFGGSKMALRMKDGSLFECQGAWSSNAHHVGRVYNDGLWVEGGVIVQAEWDKVPARKHDGDRQFGGWSMGVRAWDIVDWYLQEQRDHMGLIIYSAPDGRLEIEPTKPGNYSRTLENGSHVHHVLKSGRSYAYNTPWCVDLRNKIRELLTSYGKDCKVYDDGLQELGGDQIRCVKG
jgi:hypothetical protein